MKTRKLFQTTLFVAVAVIASATTFTSCMNSNANGEPLVESFIATGDAGFEQLDLPYAFDALEPNIDAKTMEVHFSKHHAGYTRKFNAAVEAEGLAGKSIDEIFASVSEYSPAVRNNGGGYYNHSLFWNFLSPDGGGEPSGALADALVSDFGSVEEFVKIFSSAGATQFGSGWAWLIVNAEGNLEVTATPNQDNPLMDIAPVKGTPILNLDVWEHAYYLQYQNLRKEYISNFWNVINWKVVEQLYADATK